MKTKIIVLFTVVVSFVSSLAQAQDLTLKLSSINRLGYMKTESNTLGIQALGSCTYEMKVAESRTAMKKGDSFLIFSSKLADPTASAFPLNVEFINIDIKYYKPVVVQAFLTCGASVRKSNFLKLDLGARNKGRFRYATPTTRLKRFAIEMIGSGFVA
jgi:hypothetical protein